MLQRIYWNPVVSGKVAGILTRAQIVKVDRIYMEYEWRLHLLKRSSVTGNIWLWFSISPNSNWRASKIEPNGQTMWYTDQMMWPTESCDQVILMAEDFDTLLDLPEEEADGNCPYMVENRHGLNAYPGIDWLAQSRLAAYMNPGMFEVLAHLLARPDYRPVCVIYFEGDVYACFRLKDSKDVRVWELHRLIGLAKICHPSILSNLITFGDFLWEAAE